MKYADVKMQLRNHESAITAIKAILLAFLVIALFVMQIKITIYSSAVAAILAAILLVYLAIKLSGGNRNAV